MWHWAPQSLARIFRYKHNREANENELTKSKMLLCGLFKLWPEYLANFPIETGRFGSVCNFFGTQAQEEPLWRSSGSPAIYVCILVVQFASNWVWKSDCRSGGQKSKMEFLIRAGFDFKCDIFLFKYIKKQTEKVTIFTKERKAIQVGRIGYLKKSFLLKRK